MPKENQNFELEKDPRNTDKVLSETEDAAMMPEDIGTYRLYEKMVQNGELEGDPKRDASGKIIGYRMIKEKDIGGKKGKTLYFEDKKMLDDIDAYGKKFSQPEN
ncbi:hypothetical protein A2W54_02185 [Candidatus Giovannonibacteria bacterium RIFCSPHIGHO2_02_43_13]|uniref:Uncharacterized protein n=1 Tax=Candidatus Giovannonibacteria bacterium RIFCSPHIGHO2_02_43_13 TaxID=1798330 RepID=A0A1F5WUE4_9BACT|nr:MAG: hypothetical protein A2W54_02185 [Candidatus Giovannonibacteria bacterium RIFCSPHIGHO2_02_43_13]